MRNVLKLFIFLSIVFSLAANARVNMKPFSISIEAMPKVLKGLEKRAEFKLARSTSYCRGFYIPKAISRWTCKPVGPKRKRCKLYYRCKGTTKSFNRTSETKRIKRQLDSMKVSKQRLRIKVSRKPYKKRRYKKKHFIKKAQFKKAPKIVAPRSNIHQEDIDRELDELAKFNENDKVDEAMMKSELDKELSSNLEDDLDEELEDMRDEVDEKTEKLSRRKRSKESDDGGDANVNEDSSPYSDTGKVDLLEFSLSMIQVADDSDSLVTLGASWTPRKRFNSKLGMRGQFGLKSLKAFAGTTAEETFLVYELGLYLYLNFTDSLYAEVGYLLQKWTNTEGDSSSALSLGLGYIFETKKLSVFDRFFINYSTVSNKTSNRELKLALGVSF